ncbi:hypothetical protein AO242_24820 [Pseudomonas sp. ICMP 561]|nr:hypothetical protein AO242_24820 [Pseudomonas sp. ICMP 561]
MILTSICKRPTVSSPGFCEGYVYKSTFNKKLLGQAMHKQMLSIARGGRENRAGEVCEAQSVAGIFQRPDRETSGVIGFITEGDGLIKRFVT